MSWFDKLASRVEKAVARPLFFTICVLTIVLWAPTMLFMPIDSSQLIINTITTCVTFLLVALLQNTQRRFENSVNCKLNAMAEAEGEFMCWVSRWLMAPKPVSRTAQRAIELEIDVIVTKLKDTVGVEEEMGT